MRSGLLDSGSATQVTLKTLGTGRLDAELRAAERD